uniref:Uncharacterized mitochondrial protein AtMg00810-like n=1 Tax=Tanacetum cinerariifolium TaxID=118510 RepID=A0A6L2L893_TANCI|nr:uncharacterized mitochondrial protein AtMg00810-like [Tanacetum cinerariifolium]
MFICLLMARMIRLRVMMIISYLALLFGYYVKKKYKGSYAYFAESGNCLFSSSTKWVIDSGASDHMTGNLHIFNNFDTHASLSHITTADGSISQVLGSGTVNLSPSISLSPVLSLPKFSFNLLSVSRITSNLQCSVKFYPEYCVFKDLKTKKIIGRGRKYDGLYVYEQEVSKSLVGLSSSSPFKTHCRLGHPSLQSIKKLCPEYSHLSSLNCDSFYPSEMKLRLDLCFRNLVVLMGFRLRVMMIISYLALLFGYYVKKKYKGSYAYFAESGNCLFSSSTKWVIDSGASDHMTDLKTKKIIGRGRKCDGLYVYEQEHGILHESSCVYKPAQNEVAERKNRHLLEVACALLFQMTVPKPFWADVVSTTCFLINHMPSAVLGGNYPYSDTQPNITKLDPKSLKCVFLGYSRIQKGGNDDLLVYVSPTPVETTKQSAELDGPPFKVYDRRPRIRSDLVREPSTQLKDAPNDAPNNAPNDVSNDSPNDVSNDVPISAPNEACGKYDAPSDAPSSSDSPSPSPTPELDLPIALQKDSILVPKTVGEALAHSGWRTAMIEEINALDYNGTWALARLVAKGYAQTHGIDYSETFSLVANISCIRLFISLATTYDWALHQLHVKNAFLHGDLEEEVYMKQPSGFVAQGEFERVCKLKKALYGLKQSLRACSKGICLSQRKYYLDLLDDACQIKAKPCDEPMIPKLKLRSKDGRLLHNPEKYRRVVGKLNYLTITRPDIAFPVNVASQFLTAPRTSHWDVVTQILGYLKGITGLGILYANHGHHIAEGFTYADYAGCPNTSRSTMEYCVFVGGNLVSWKSKKQNVVSRSSSEVEYRAMAQTACELVWLRNLLGEIGFPQSKPIKMWCDNQAAIYIATNPVFHERTKHIEVDCHFTREKLKDGTITTPHIRTESRLADVLTKAFPGTHINSICNKLGMINIYAQLEGEC